MKPMILVLALAVSFECSTAQAISFSWFSKTFRKITTKSSSSPQQPPAEKCGDGKVKSGTEECDDGNTVNTDWCTNACKFSKCGDSIINAGVEGCDDGNQTNGDGCDYNCKATGCGNAVVTAGEECDDGNQTNGDGCQANCALPKCGDSILDAGEECDDGNQIDNDSCANVCKRPPQIFTVTSFTDGVDDDVGKGGCHTADNVCTLRAAVQEANATVAPDEIIIPAGTYTLSIARVTETGQDTANQFEGEGDIDIWQPLVLKGEGADKTVIQSKLTIHDENDHTVILQQGLADRLFHVASGGTVVFQGLTLDANHEFSSGRGGVLYAVSAGGTVEVDGCVVKNGIGNEGGGLSMNAPLTFNIRNSTISGNSGTRGGGFFCETGTCLIINSTFSGNTSVSTGGGAIDNTTGTMTIINSTFVGNTVTDNNGTGGALRVGQAVTLKNSILVNNTINGTPANCDGDLADLTSGGHNLSDDGTCSTRFNATGDLNSVAGTIVEATLAANGGKTPTHLLPANSPAVDLVAEESCTDQNNTALPADQRGVIRPADGNKDAKALCDAGAVEVQ